MGEKKVVISDFEKLHKRERYVCDNTPNYTKPIDPEHELLGTYGTKDVTYLTSDINLTVIEMKGGGEEETQPNFYITA